MAQLVSVQRTEKGIVVCLLLEPSETSPELRTFARPRKRSRIPAQLATSLKLPIVSSVEPASPPPSSPAESESLADRAFSLRQQAALRLSGRIFDFQPTGGTLDVATVKEPLARDDFVSRARALLPKSPSGRAFSAAVGGLSRGLAGILGLEEDTVSATLANQRGTTTQAVHFELGAPGLGIPVLGGAIEGALRGDLLTALENRDIRTLTRIRSTLESVPQVSGVGRKKRDMLDRVAKRFIERLEPD